jgi:hypothetical protein
VLGSWGVGEQLNILILTVVLGGLILSSGSAALLASTASSQVSPEGIAAPPPAPAYYVYGYVKIHTNTSTVAAAGVTVWINDTTNPSASQTAVTDSAGKYQVSSLAPGYKNGDALVGASHKYGNATGTNSTTVVTSKPGSWLNLSLVYPQLTPHLSANVTSGEAPLWVHLFNNRTAAPTLGGNGSYVFGWKFGDGTPSLWNQAHPYIDHNYSQGGPYCAQLVVNDSAGDSWQTPCLSITSNAPPSISSFTDTPQAVNESQSVSFTASVSGGTAPYTYNYQFGQAGASVSLSSSLATNSTTHAYTAPSNASYEANLTVTDSAAKTAGPSHVPVWVYLIDLHATPNPADAGQTVTITADAQGGSGGAAYTFFFAYGDGAKQTATCLATAICTVTHAYASSGSYIVTLLLNDTATNSVTNSAQAVSVAAVLGITVNAPLHAAISSNVTYTDINSPVALTDTASGGTLPYLYFNITTGAGTYSNFTNSLPSVLSYTLSGVSYPVAGTYHPTARAGDSVGTSNLSSMGLLVVNSTPVVNLTIYRYLGPATSSAYVGEVLTVEAQMTAGTGTPGFSFNISFGGGSFFLASCTTSGCNVSTTHIYGVAGTYTLRVNVTDSVGVVGTSSAPLTVYNALATPTLVANRTAGEVSLSVAFNASVTGGVPGLTFAWQFGNGNTLSVAGLSTSALNQEFQTYSVVTNTSVNLTVNDTQGESVSVSLKLFIYPDLGASFTNSTLTGNLNPPVNATFHALVSGGSGTYVSYNWTFGNGNVANGLTGPNSPVTTYWNSGRYTVHLLVKDNVSDHLLVTETFLVSGVNTTLHLNVGWNLVASPTTNESYSLWAYFHVLTAIYGSSAATTSVTVQNVTGAGNVSYPGGGAYAATYAVAPGRGVWVDVSLALTVTLSGNLTTGPLFPALSLQSGWNNVGWSLSGATNASALAALVPNASAISMWNSTTQSYVTFIVGFSDPSYDFAVSDGTGVLVWVPSSTSMIE